MFEKFFVTCPVAIALRAAGYDEPCMAVHEYYEFNGKPFRKLHIVYLAEPPATSIYSDKIQKLMETHPGLFKEFRTNQKFPPWLYAAPLYDQVFDWLGTKGLHLHVHYIAKDVLRKDHGVWGCSVYDITTGNLLSPLFKLTERIEYPHKERRTAIEQAILAALKLQSHEPKTNV